MFELCDVALRDRVAIPSKGNVKTLTKNFESKSNLTLFVVYLCVLLSDKTQQLCS